MVVQIPQTEGILTRPPTENSLEAHFPLTLAQS